MANAMNTLPGSEEREEGEIVENELEDVSDCSLTSGFSLDFGKSVSSPELLSGVCLSSISSNECDLETEPRHSDMFIKRTKRPRKRHRDHRRKKRKRIVILTNSFNNESYKKPTEPSSESDVELDSSYINKLKDALKREPNGLHHSLRRRLKGFIESNAYSDDDSQLEEFRDALLLASPLNSPIIIDLCDKEEEELRKSKKDNTIDKIPDVINVEDIDDEVQEVVEVVEKIPRVTEKRSRAVEKESKSGNARKTIEKKTKAIKERKIMYRRPKVIEKEPRITRKKSQVARTSKTTKKVAKTVEKERKTVREHKIIDKVPRVATKHENKTKTAKEPRVIDKVQKVAQKDPRIVRKEPKLNEVTKNVEKVTKKLEKVVPKVVENELKPVNALKAIEKETKHAKERKIIDKTPKVVEKESKPVNPLKTIEKETKCAKECKIIDKVPKVVEKDPQISEKVSKMVENVRKKVEKVQRDAEKHPKYLETVPPYIPLPKIVEKPKAGEIEEEQRVAEIPDDSELQELRLAALKSFVIEHHERRKRKAEKQDCNSNNVCENTGIEITKDSNKENDQTVINNDIETRNKKPKLDTDKEEELDSTKIKSAQIPEKIVTQENSDDTLMEEDADVLRAMLLASMSQNLAAKTVDINPTINEIPQVKPIQKPTALTVNPPNVNTNSNLKVINKNDLYNKVNAKESIQLPVVKPLIISLNADSDSDTENFESNNSIRDTVAEFLKKQRAEVEANVKKKSESANSTFNSSDDLLMEKSAMKLLPRSQQLEYRKLKQQLINAKRKTRLRRPSQRLLETKAEVSVNKKIVQVNKKVPKINSDNPTVNTATTLVKTNVQETKTLAKMDIQRTLTDLQIQKNGRYCYDFSYLFFLSVLILDYLLINTTLKE